MNRVSRSRSGSVKRKIIEIVGPAGAGKSTLCHRLTEYPDRIRLGNFPDVHRWVDAPFYILNGIQLIPNLIRLPHSNSRRLTRREFAWLSILHGWATRLQSQLDHENRDIVLDQGPVYLLTEMLLFGPEYLRQNSADKLWQGLCERWGSILDMVVFLDAADDILLERIRTRQQDLVVKEQPAAVVYEYLNSYRMKYHFLLTVLAANRTCPKIIQFDTGCQQPQYIVNTLLSELDFLKTKV
jgi:deoxyadenosine/deoxycytidine kinase